MELHKKFKNVIEFRRALNHYALINEFEYKIEKIDLERLTACCEDKKCEWRIHASTTEDKITFQVKKFLETHSCTRSNKCGNKRATQGWIANVIADKLKSDGDMSATEIMKWLMKTYNVDVPYMRAFRGKEQAYMDMHGKWEDSFMQMDVFRHELLTRNVGSVVDIAFETKDGKKHFQRFFICLAACSRGFLAGCRPYISLDGKDQWVHIDTSEKIHPPIVKRPIGRPRKNRIVAHDETKKRHKCTKCNGYGHHQKSCKNPPSSQISEPFQAPTRKRGRAKKGKYHQNALNLTPFVILCSDVFF